MAPTSSFHIQDKQATLTAPVVEQQKAKTAKAHKPFHNSSFSKDHKIMMNLTIEKHTQNAMFSALSRQPCAFQYKNKANKTFSQ